MLFRALFPIHLRIDIVRCRGAALAYGAKVNGNPKITETPTGVEENAAAAFGSSIQVEGASSWNTVRSKKRTRDWRKVSRKCTLRDGISSSSKRSRIPAFGTINHRANGGFTLLESLLVVGVIAFLIGMLAPLLSRARQHARSIQCLSNQRQIAMAMHAYAADYDGVLPIAHYFDLSRSSFVTWDTVTDFTTEKVSPGLIWEFVDGSAVQQCPSYDGPSFTLGDPYTGYNYNTTYLGRGQNEGEYRGMRQKPATLSCIRGASRVAMIGDGGWSGGANKFMRAPLDCGVAEGTVHAGTQAFRHLKRTSVAYADGHAACVSTPHQKHGAARGRKDNLGWPNNGFLSSDDRAYDHLGR